MRAETSKTPPRHELGAKNFAPNPPWSLFLF